MSGTNNRAGGKAVKLVTTAQAAAPIDLEAIPPEVTEEDERIFREVTATELSADQIERVRTPGRTFPKQRYVMAVHWHPEFVPMDHIVARIDALFPNRTDELVIPTQHNVFTDLNGYHGVEVDCFARGFNQKVQLLLHLRSEKMAAASKLEAMLRYTFKYRSSQLFDFIDTILEPKEERLQEAARETGASEDLIAFVQLQVGKIAELLDRHADAIEPAAIKNKLLRNFFDALRPRYGDALINRSQTFLRAVKMIVKAHFPPHYFYRASEVIEEARSIGAGIVVPHPEQFWPILLADYEVDGYEVWNPQSRKYTEFLISAVNRKNRQPGLSRRRLLVFMGDDTHMGEKVKDPAEADKAKAARELGVQPAWHELSVRKKLIKSGMERHQVIAEYRSRL